MKRNKGITLIALVITIIVLLILAGITINILFGENGILDKAKRSKIETSHANVKEMTILALNEYILENKDPNEKYEGISIEYLLEKGYISEKDNYYLTTEKLLNGASLGKGTEKPNDVYAIEKISDNNYVLRYYEKSDTFIDLLRFDSKGKQVNVAEENNISKEEFDEEFENAEESDKATIGDKNIVKIDPNTAWQKNEDETIEEIEISVDTTPGELDGTGTEADPYKIQSIEDLVAFSLSVAEGNEYEGKTVVLTRNLYFNGEFNSYVDPNSKYAMKYDTNNKMIGYIPDETSRTTIKQCVTGGAGFAPIGLGIDYGCFKGIFDGRGNYLANIYIVPSFTTNTALFGYVKNTDVDIKNLGIESGSIGARWILCCWNIRIFKQFYRYFNYKLL